MTVLFVCAENRARSPLWFDRLAQAYQPGAIIVATLVAYGDRHASDPRS